MREATKILLVEDDRICAIPVIMMLKKLGCHVTHASNADQTIAISSKNLFDLIIMDVGLGAGQLDGIEVAKFIKQAAGLNKDTPVVALTGRSISDDVNACLDMGMKQFYIKPASPDALKEMLEQYVA